MYEILLTETASARLKKLDKETQRRIISALDRVRIRPENYIKRLVGSPYFRLRVGDYRLIVDIRRDELIVLVLTMGHRKNVYKRL